MRVFELDHEIEFFIGDEVYIKTDPYQNRGLITAISLRPNNLVVYSVSINSNETYHYNFELSREKDLR
jgi:hypothetical protein